MSIDIQCEKVLSLREVREILPRKRGKPLHLSSVYRWTSEGLQASVWKPHSLAVSVARAWKPFSAFSMHSRR